MKELKLTRQEVIDIIDDALKEMYDECEDNGEDDIDEETKDHLLKIEYIFKNYEDWLNFEEDIIK